MKQREETDELDSPGLTVQEISAGLMITNLTVYKWCRGEIAGPKLPIILSGKQRYGNPTFYIDEDVLVEWLSANRPEFLPIWRNRKKRKVKTPKAGSGRASYNAARFKAAVEAKVKEIIRQRK